MSLLLLAVVYAVVYGFLFCFESRRKIAARLVITPTAMLMAVVMAVTVFAVSNLSFVSGDEVTIVVFYIRTLVDFADVLILSVQHEQLRETALHSELAAMDNVLHRQYEQYKQSKENIRLINRRYHELKMQIAAIRAERDKVKQDAALAEMEGDIHRYEAENKTGNPVLDTLLTAKSMYCQQHGINLTCVADGFALNVTVTNTGKAAGKEVVQAYLQNPYTEYDCANRIEKPAVELVGFAKTDILQPGESQTVKIDVDKSALKVFDAYGAGTYILEAGDYYLTAASNAHEAAKNILAAKGAEVDGNAAMTALYNQAQTDTRTFATAETGAAVTAQLADGDIATYDADFTYLSRSDWSGTWPTTYQNGSWEAPEAVLTALEITRPEDESAEMPAFDKAGNLKLCDLIGADYDDARWETLLSQMSKKDTYNLIRHAGYGTMAVESIGAPGTVHKDGPAGISSTLAGGNLHCMAYEPAVVLASTYNVELASRRGKLVGEDSLSSGVQVWYAPAMNIHRAANSGRNFEYYAEDPLLSGVFGAAETAGFQSKGGIVTIKHFAFNDQETNRIGGAMFVNEQAARQLYLKPFEMSVVDGGAVGIMSGMNRIGCRWIGGHEGIMTNILRGEWGYKGFVITDQTSFNSFDYCDIREGLAAGNDLWLNTAYNMWALNDSELTATVMQNARTAAHRYLYAVANSNAMNGVDADTTVKNIIPAWQYTYVALVVFVAVMWFFGFKAVRALWASKRYLAKKAERKAKRAAKKAAKAQKAQ